MATAEQREKLKELIMGNGLGAVRWSPVPSGKAWGSRVPGFGNARAATHAPAAQRKLLAWIRRAYGDAFAELVQIRANELSHRGGSGLGQEKEPWWNRIVDAVTDVGSKYLQYKTQKDLLEVQLDRAEQGLPPLNTGEYAPSVQVGLDPETVQRITDEAARRAAAAGGAIMQSPLTWGLLALGGFAVFSMLQNKPRRRRR